MSAEKDQLSGQVLRLHSSVKARNFSGMTIARKLYEISTHILSGVAAPN
jgi:hypothetical protein